MICDTTFYYRSKSDLYKTKKDENEFANKRSSSEKTR